MFRWKIPARFGLTIFGIEIISNNDVIDPKSPTAQKLSEQAKIIIQSETGWDRLKAIFHTDEFNAFSPELDNTFTAASIGTLIGFLIGALPASKREYEDFINRNKASKFESHFDAKSKLQYSVTKAMAEGGWRVGWRLGLFTGAYTFFTTAVSTYRNKSSVFEYSAGGLLAGSMYKLPMGPKAMVSGGLAGVALGTVAGCVSVGIMKLTGTTTEELRYWKKGWKEASNREISSYSNPAKARAAGYAAIVHDMELANKASQKNVDDLEAEKEVNCEKNSTQMSSSDKAGSTTTSSEISKR